LTAESAARRNRAMGKPELATDQRFKSVRARHANRFELQAISEVGLASFRIREEAVPAIDKEQVACAPVLSVNECVARPQLNHETVRWLDDPLLGKVAIPAVPVKFFAWPDRSEPRSSAPGRGQGARAARLPRPERRALHASGMLVRDPPNLTEVNQWYGLTKKLTRKGKSWRAIALIPRRSIRA
jgi:crotonobetainyl-CoA:carnitine CoA-transferase CaiB-like acyl-CoA transferase